MYGIHVFILFIFDFIPYITWLNIRTFSHLVCVRFFAKPIYLFSSNTASLL